MKRHTNVFNHLESEVQSYPRAFPCIFNHACGTKLWDAHSHRYPDFLVSAGPLNYRHNDVVLKQALLDHIRNDEITHSLDLHTLAKEKFLPAMRYIVLRLILPAVKK